MSFFSYEDIFIIGIRRSGNHGIANWLIPHCEGTIRYFNDYVFEEQINSNAAYIKGRPTYFYLNFQDHVFFLLNEGALWPIQDLFAKKFAQILHRKIPFIPKRFLQQLEDKVNAISIVKDCSRLPYWIEGNNCIESSVNFFGCENYLPKTIANVFPQWEESVYQPIAKKHNQIIAENRTFLLILRNPFNNLASMMQKLPYWPPNHISPEQFPAVWIAYAKEFLGDTAFLAKLGKVIPINYDLWFIDKQYRQSLSEKIGKKFTDEGLQKISLNGSGSSFDKHMLAEKAQAMNVLERWKLFKNNKKYRFLLNNKELLKLYERIYGSFPFVP